MSMAEGLFIPFHTTVKWDGMNGSLFSSDWPDSVDLKLSSWSMLLQAWYVDSEFGEESNNEKKNHIFSFIMISI